MKRYLEGIRVGRWSAKLHFALLACVPVALMLPPIQGTMLILPIVPGGEAAITWATRSGARLIGQGPVPGSVVVEASSASLWAAALSNRAVIMRAEFVGCGSSGELK